MVVAIVTHLSGLPTIALIIFGVLPFLGLYIIVRSVQGLGVLRGNSGNQHAVIDHTGFVLISLFDGFAIVSAFDLGAPGWLLAIIAVGAVMVGIYGINARKKTLKARSLRVPKD